MRFFVFVLALLGCFSISSVFAAEKPVTLASAEISTAFDLPVFHSLPAAAALQVNQLPQPAATSCTWRQPNVNESTTLVVTGVGSFPATITAVYSGSEAFDFTYVKNGDTHYVYEFKFEDWIEVSSNNYIIATDHQP